MKSKTMIQKIKKIRRRNNELWMELLRLALDTAPVESRKVVAEINKNDMEISNTLKEFVNDES